MSQFIHNPEEVREYDGRHRLFYLMIAGTFVVFFIRLWYLQIYSGTQLREISENNRIKQTKILSPRGLMLDRDGKVLVENLPGFEAILQPQYLEDLDALVKAIAPILGMEQDKLFQKIQKTRKQNGPFAYIRVKENLSREEVFRLKRIRLDYPGLEIRESIVRSYPLKENGGQLFGYLGEISKRQLPLLNDLYKGKLRFDQGDLIGKSGLEEAIEKDIRGTDGLSFVQVDAHGRETVSTASYLYGDTIKDLEPIHGNNAVLTIDRDLQKAAFDSMTSLNRIGAVLAMQPDGEILAWVNMPSFNPNEFTGEQKGAIWNKLVNDPFKPFRNKVIQDHAAPGSSFKPMMALAALQEKVVTPTTVVASPAVFFFGKRPYHDSIRQGHGNITIYDALEQSSNVFFYKMGIALGVDKVYSYVSNFGLGQKTGIQIPREAAGILPSSTWKKQIMGEEWQPGENLSLGIGQGFVAVTAIQMAVAYNAIATEGKVVRPFVVKKIIDQDGKVQRENEGQVVRDLTQEQSNGIHIDVANFKVVKEAMRRVANGPSGTARYWKIPGVEIAGKTGTAQTIGFAADQVFATCESRPIQQRPHGWFIGWAPWDKPEIIVSVLAEHACHGGPGAAPIVRDIIKAYFQKHHPEVLAGHKIVKPAEPVQVIEGE